MGKRSKVKGNSFEREVKKQFERYWGIRLERTPLSGGWGKMNTKGDLVAASDSGFVFFVECKKDECWELHHLLTGAGTVFQSWWPKACEQAQEESKIPLLVFSRNRVSPIVRFPSSLIPGPVEQKFDLWDNSSLILLSSFLSRVCHDGSARS